MAKTTSGRRTHGRPLDTNKLKKSNNSPHHDKRQATSNHGHSQPVAQPTAWQLIYVLALKPWIFVTIVASYWIFSLALLFEKYSSSNIIGALVSSFVLFIMIAHNFSEVLNCLGKMFRQTGIGLSLVGKVLQHSAKRLNQLFREKAQWH